MEDYIGKTNASKYDTGPFARQEMQNDRPPRIAVSLEILKFAVR
jgi:hypothetical protein